MQAARRSVLVLAILAAALLAAWRFFGPVHPPSGVELTDLTNVEQLKARFNDDVGSARLILILSPT